MPWERYSQETRLEWRGNPRDPLATGSHGNGSKLINNSSFPAPHPKKTPKTTFPGCGERKILWEFHRGNALGNFYNIGIPLQAWSGTLGMLWDTRNALLQDTGNALGHQGCSGKKGMSWDTGNVLGLKGCSAPRHQECSGTVGMLCSRTPLPHSLSHSCRSKEL